MTTAEPLQTASDSLHTALRQIVSDRKHDLWFSSLRVVTQADPIVLAVANSFLRDWIQTNYLSVLEQAVHQAFSTSAGIELVVGDDGDVVPGEDASVVPAEPAPPRPERDIAKNNQSFFVRNSDVVLNRQYTFDNFVVGASNQLAHAAALAVAEAPAGAYNPLFLHGTIGLGKTHLLQAVCQKALRAGRRLKVLYLSSETFVNQFIAAIEQGDLSRFRYKYRNVDMLLIDDIHLLANKERTQEEFFHTFNTLYNSQRQIVLSSDSPPSEIPTLKERLVSRFKWGLVAEIEPPGYETRLAILRRKARDRAGSDVPEEVLTYLAENIDRNIRELEGAVTKVIGYAQLISEPIGLDLARKALGQSGQAASHGVTGVERIQEIVCGHYDVRIADLQGRRRTHSIVLPRQVAMFLARKLTPLSLEEIGGRFGGRDHSTVLYAISKIRNRMSDDAGFGQLVSELEARSRR